VVEDDRGPWWANDPELIEIRRELAPSPTPATISNVPAPPAV
jgi:hypothetical protein